MTRSGMFLLVSLLSVGVAVGLLIALYLGVRRGAVPKGLGLAAIVGCVALGYIALMLSNRALGLDYQSWGGSPSFEHARSRGTVVGVYDASCTGETTARAVYAERMTRKELGPLLWPRTLTSDAVKVVAGVDSPDRRSRRLAFEDGAGATLDERTGKASVRDEDPDETSCCFDVRLQAPERFWLVQEGERVCEFTLRPSTDS